MSAPAPGRALVIGEALIDVVRGTDGTTRSHPGGSPANVALGLARLGRDAELLTWFADDDGGAQLTAHLASSGVTLGPGSTGAERTSTATATLDATGAATYVFDIDWRPPPLAPRPDVAVVHTGSIAAVLEPGAGTVLEAVRAHRSTASVTYDPNLRPALMGSAEQAAPYVEAMLAEADVVKASDEDLAWYLPGRDPGEVAAEWAGRRERSGQGPGLVVVTEGGSGAFAVTSGGLRVDVPAPSVEVADTVGAGDSFMGGLIDGLWTAGLLGAGHREALGTVDAQTLEAVLARCTRIAAVTVSRPGADPPSSAELEE